MELLLSILLVIKSFGWEKEVKPGSSNLNYHMALTKPIMLIKEQPDIELDLTLKHIALTVLEHIHTSEIIKSQYNLVLLFPMHQEWF